MYLVSLSASLNSQAVSFLSRPKADSSVCFGRSLRVRHVQTMSYSVPFSFLRFFFVCFSLHLCACPCSHPTLLVTLATTYAFYKPGNSPWIVYDQAGVLLLKVIGHLMYRQPAVRQSVCRLNDSAQRVELNRSADTCHAKNE